MKNKRTNRPARTSVTVLRQLCNLIPNHLVPKLAREHGAAAQARVLSPWSHVVAMLYAQLSHAIGLNDVCDTLALFSGPLSAVRGATAPARNTLSHANRTRDAAMAEALLWSVLEHLQTLKPGFGLGRMGRGVLRRFRRCVHAIDTTVIELVANCMDWAKHRRRKAAAKLHLRLNLQSLLPSFAIVGSAREADARRARQMCAGLLPGEIAVFDMAFLDFEHLADLSQRGVWWVSRAKSNMAYTVVEKRPVPKGGRILRDEIVALVGRAAKSGEFVRRIEAIVEIEGRDRLMVFLTNNFDWSPHTVCDLYRCRWDIEAFFKQIKQTLNLSDFLGHNANAVRWQIWTALLAYVLLRFQAFVSRWHHSFTRLFTLARATLWQRIDLTGLLRSYGTAGGHFRFVSAPREAWLPGILEAVGQHTPRRRPRRMARKS
jgi:hypothetical protein